MCINLWNDDQDQDRKPVLHTQSILFLLLPWCPYSFPPQAHRPTGCHYRLVSFLECYINGIYLLSILSCLPLYLAWLFGDIFRLLHTHLGLPFHCQVAYISLSRSRFQCVDQLMGILVDSTWTKPLCTQENQSLNRLILFFLFGQIFMREVTRLHDRQYVKLFSEPANSFQE